MTSGTKFIGGHADVTLGVLSVKGSDLAKKVYFLQVGGWRGRVGGGLSSCRLGGLKEGGQGVCGV